jgi:hypothetical protein
VGKRGDASSLPDTLRQREAPNDRKQLGSLVQRGTF